MSAVIDIGALRCPAAVGSVQSVRPLGASSAGSPTSSTPHSARGDGPNGVPVYARSSQHDAVVATPKESS